MFILTPLHEWLPSAACMSKGLPCRRVLRQLRRSLCDFTSAAVQSYYELEAEEYKRKVSLAGL